MNRESPLMKSFPLFQGSGEKIHHRLSEMLALYLCASHHSATNGCCDILCNLLYK